VFGHEWRNQRSHQRSHGLSTHSSISLAPSTMAKSRKARVQTSHAKDLKSLEQKSILLSNTSKRLRRVVTSVPTPESHSQKHDNDDPSEMMVDDGVDLCHDANPNVTSCTDFEHPAALRVRTKAKRYQNSVREFISLLFYSN
jgi:hypothetical protein